MAIETQITANSQNAEQSSGPKSAGIGQRAPGGALAHGLAGHHVIRPGEMVGQIQERMSFLRPTYRPDNQAEEWLFIRICVESVRADHCLHHLIAQRDEAATQAVESWDDDRALEAEELGAGIGRKPEVVRPRLLRSKHGARWLLAQWEELERRHELTGAWPESASNRALDLLGVPADARLGAWDRLAPDGPSPAIRTQVGALRARLEGYLNARDDRAQRDAVAGIGPDGSEVRRVLRNESATLRRLQAWTRELRRLQNPASRPAPRVDRGYVTAPDFDRPVASPTPPHEPPPPERPTADPDRTPDSGPHHDRPARPSAPVPATSRPASPAPAPIRTSPLLPAPASALNRHERRAADARARRSPRA